MRALFSRLFFIMLERRDMDKIVSELTETLGSYNKTVNSSISAINKSLMAIGYILISILFLIEMLSWYRFIRNQGGEMTWKLFLEIFYCLLFSSSIRCSFKCNYVVY